MKFTVLTIFPEMFNSFWAYGIIKKAIAENHIYASAINIRDFAKDKHKTTDDRPFGGGCGMVMKPEPLANAIRMAKEINPDSKTVLLSPQGRIFNQNLASKLAASKGLNLVCGRYEGIDERICSNFIDDEISLGDYVLMGGELAAMVIIEAVTRLIPGVLGSPDSALQDSFSGKLLDYCHYTRPREFEGSKVPEVLLSGNHKDINDWRLEAALIRTFFKRPDLIENRPLTKQENEILKKWCRDIENIIQTQSLRGSGTLSGN
ncbi:MAG: tRNA (guanosine(37)-N1)-methyltransferase TrmD [Desulfobacterium sp.]|nr:tRNA (guanosine(37)-N1)-methyltransferase TrmD [Desulfobacterium sp.]MBU3947507.1 tRNA (guanosine(37)-N1)-methyltransferase TrmD [Pseudomonadota bacterium]MBU4036853.1 tRNA (guanosine(37)-N1)-methyltransferase TrmD [Pseudomonadota bacterium]